MPLTVNLQQIGKTSSLVLTLCGVLKDVLLVLASVAIWGTTITGLQVFGYSIALGGLVHYKLGGEKLKEIFREKRMAWSEYGNRRPVVRRLLVIGAVCFTFVLIAVQFSGSKYYNSVWGTTDS